MTPLIHHVHDSLVQRAMGVDNNTPVLIMLGAWLGVQTGGDPNAVLEDAIAAQKSAPTYRDVAVLGLGVAAKFEDQGCFADGVDWLKGRKYHIPGGTPGFEADPLAMFAVAVGLSTTQDRPDFEWLFRLIRDAVDHHLDAWNDAILCAALTVLDATPRPKIQAQDVVAALASMGWAVSLSEKDALTACLDLEHCDPEVALVRLAGLRWLVRQEARVDFRHPTINDLVCLLEQVPNALKRWRWEHKKSSQKATIQRWDIQNEYHVQSLLWTILAPMFPDLVDEEYLPPRGPKQPRADLGIPSLRVIIEVKFMRAGQAARVVGEVAEDVTLYLSGEGPYEALVVFVWDKSASTNKHPVLKNGLLALDHVVEAIVVSRPGIWTENIEPAADNPSSS